MEATTVAIHITTITTGILITVTGIGETGRAMTADGTIKMIAETGTMTGKSRRGAARKLLITIGRGCLGRIGSMGGAAAIRGRFCMDRIGSMGEAVATRVVAPAAAGVDRANE